MFNRNSSLKYHFFRSCPQVNLQKIGFVSDLYFLRFFRSCPKSISRNHFFSVISTGKKTPRIRIFGVCRCMSLRLPPKVRERMRPTRAALMIPRGGLNQGTLLQRRSCDDERRSIRRQVLPTMIGEGGARMANEGGVIGVGVNDDDDVKCRGFESDMEKGLRELLHLPSKLHLKLPFDP